MSQQPGVASEGLGERAATGVAWSLVQKWAMRVTGLVTMAILARNLDAADFGVVALVMSVLPLIYLLSDMGFSTFLVQAEKVDARVLSTAFWFTASVGLVLALVIAGAAPLFALVFDEPRVAPVMVAMAPVIVVVTTGVVPTTILRRNMEFRLLALQGMAAAVLGQAAAVALVFLDAGVWALVAQALVVNGVSLVLAALGARWRPSLAFSRTDFVAMARFGSKVVGVEVVAMVRMWAENAFVVASLGTSGLGYLNIAQRLVQVAQDVTAAAIVPVSTVAFAKIRDTVPRLRDAYLRASGVAYFTVIPVMLVIVVGAPMLVPLLFGSQWAASVSAARMLAVAGILILGAMLDLGVFYGQGKPGRWLVYALVIDALTATVTAFTAPHGLLAVTTGTAAVALTATAVRWGLVGRLVAAPWWRVAWQLARASAVAVVAGGAGWGVAAVTTSWPPLLALAAASAAIVVVYVAVGKYVMATEYGEVLRIARSTLGRRRGGIAAAPAEVPRVAGGERHEMTVDAEVRGT